METCSINQPINREVLAYLMGMSAIYNLLSKREPPPDPVFQMGDEVGLNDLRAHPDLGSVLYSLALEIPGATHGYVLGYDVLINSRGVIFAVATGMMYMAFRVYPPDSRPLLPVEKASGVEALSREWRGVSPFGEPGAKDRLKPIAEKALANADKLSDR